MLVNHAHGHGPIADGRRHSLHRTAAHIPDGEHAVARSREHRAASRTRAGHHEPPPVELDRACEPLGVGVGPDQHEEGGRTERSVLVAPQISDDDLFQAPVAALSSSISQASPPSPSGGTRSVILRATSVGEAGSATRPTRMDIISATYTQRRCGICAATGAEHSPPRRMLRPARTTAAVRQAQGCLTRSAV